MVRKMSLEGKVTIVTGGGRGIGRGIALALAREGADVAIVEAEILDSSFNHYGTKEIKGYTAAQEVAKEIRALGRRAIAINADVSKSGQVAQAVKQTIDELGSIDILVNAAGVVSVSTVENMEEEAWDLTMNVNAKGVFLFSKAVIPFMKQRKWGRIINIASIAGKSGFPGLSNYCASKFAVVGFTNSLAKELARDNITVNAICPGIVRTQMWTLLADVWKMPGESWDESYVRNVSAMIPQGVEQTPEDMAKLALLFVYSEHVTGQSVNVDGGSMTF
jgi:meso-butanediol dehydrogenase/(S,S)-butanediol dehydrogenase/diacetyl reductase